MEHLLGYFLCGLVPHNVRQIEHSVRELLLLQEEIQFHVAGLHPQGVLRSLHNRIVLPTVRLLRFNDGMC